MTNIDAQTRKNSPTTKTRLKTQILKIVRRWKNNPECSLEDLELMNHSFKESFTELIPRILTIIHEQDLPLLLADLRDQAMRFYAPPTATRTSQADIRLFLIPFHGTVAALRTLLANDNAFSSLTSSFREFGLANPKAEVRLVKSDGCSPAISTPVHQRQNARNSRILTSWNILEALETVRIALSCVTVAFLTTARRRNSFVG